VKTGQTKDHNSNPKLPLSMEVKKKRRGTPTGLRSRHVFFGNPPPRKKFLGEGGKVYSINIITS